MLTQLTHSHEPFPAFWAVEVHLAIMFAEMKVQLTGSFVRLPTYLKHESDRTCDQGLSNDVLISNLMQVGKWLHIPVKSIQKININND